MKQENLNKILGVNFTTPPRLRTILGKNMIKLTIKILCAIISIAIGIFFIITSRCTNSSYLHLFNDKNAFTQKEIVNTILNIDETMSDLAELDYGEYAEAESVTSDWIVKYKDK